MDQEKLEVNSSPDHDSYFRRLTGQWQGWGRSGEGNLGNWVDVSGPESENQDHQGAERNV